LHTLTGNMRRPVFKLLWVLCTTWSFHSGD
jgi:hypothetical protein